MNAGERRIAVDLLHAAASGGPPVDDLPDGSRPSTAAEALAVQDELVARSGKRVSGWKVATGPDGTVTYGAIYADDCLDSPAIVSAGRFPLLGIEGEIAFRFLNGLPAREAPYTSEELAAVLVPFPAIEIVNSRFTSYAGTPPVVRLADRMSNGGMVIGATTGRPQDLNVVPVTVTTNGEVTLSVVGGHARKDPFLPALEFVHARQAKAGFEAGQFITTGTCTGLAFGKPGQDIAIEFKGLGSVRMAIST
ncbi:MAG: hypothetical protein H6873_07605 [Hyphomicrobiaceae bacterium]|nr:hypothetical protein [Hyphomicrobiaceae bacterium]